ncbi:MAG: hypothetical protein E6K53_04285 [Gammaproteobacteria bacterium]|nr:MAG: hypothetical protein E6K53_04285 [Gammaproteobacteria bacterium]
MRRTLLAYLAVALLGAAGVARAQVSAQVSVTNDNVFRGVSLSDGRASAAAEVNYDNDAGWFTGAQISSTRLARENHDHPEIVFDAGYAHALTSTLTWEAGATYSIFPGFTYWNYGEAFAGVLAENWSARLHYAPDYFGRSRKTLYAEYDYQYALDRHWRVIAHVGALHSAPAAADGRAWAYDGSLGIAARFGSTTLAFRRVAIDRSNYLYPLAPTSERADWVLSLAWSY